MIAAATAVNNNIVFFNGRGARPTWVGGMYQQRDNYRRLRLMDCQAAEASARVVVGLCLTWARGSKGLNHFCARGTRQEPRSTALSQGCDAIVSMNQPDTSRKAASALALQNAQLFHAQRVVSRPAVTSLCSTQRYLTPHGRQVLPQLPKK